MFTLRAGFKTKHQDEQGVFLVDHFGDRTLEQECRPSGFRSTARAKVTQRVGGDNVSTRSRNSTHRRPTIDDGYFILVGRVPVSL
jgi:hypothetical protein